MPLTVEQFVRRLVDAELLFRDELDEFVAGLSPRPADGEQLANVLVRQRKLTKHQAQVAYAGNGKSLLLGNYVILDRIGAGGMGEVFLARHRRMGRMAALKILPAKVAGNPDAVRRFHNTAGTSTPSDAKTAATERGCGWADAHKTSGSRQEIARSAGDPATAARRAGRQCHSFRTPFLPAHSDRRIKS